MGSSFKFLFPLLVSLCLAYCAKIDPITEALIDASITSYFLNEHHIPGFGMSIVRDGEVIFSKGYGYRNVEKNLTVTNSTLFGLGSVTKIITATMAVKVLMEKFPELGGSVMDTPISKLGPDLNLTLPDRYRTENINFIDLFSHRHCMGQSGLSLLVGAIPTSEEFAYRQRYIGQTGSFRSGCFSYSNEVYGYAGEALAQIMNSTYADLMVGFMREIGMEDAIVVDKDGDYEKSPNFNNGYYWRDDLQANQLFNYTLWRKIYVAPGGGGIFASPRDMAAFLNFHLRLGWVGDKEVMNAGQLNIVYNVAERLGFGGEKHSQTDLVSGNLGYGLGVTVSLLDGWKIYQHAGNFPPFRNKYSFSHSQSLGIFTTCNSMSVHEGDMDMVHMMVAEIFRKNTTKIYTSYDQLPMDEIREKAKQFPTSDFDYVLKFPEHQPTIQAEIISGNFALNESDLVGFYGHNVHGNLHIYLGINQTLSMIYGSVGLATLEFLEGNFYKVNWTTDILHQFYADSGYREITFKVEFLGTVMNMFMDDNHLAGFTKGGFLNTAPVTPWAPDSCSP